MTRRQLASMQTYLALLTVTLLAGCSGESRPPLLASDIVINAELPGQSMSAGYLSLTNTTNDDIVISHVTSAAYGSVELHESSIQNGVARMRPITELIVHANSTVTLRPGGVHLMLMKSHGSEQLTLSFFADKTLLLTVSSTISQRRQ